MKKVFTQLLFIVVLLTSISFSALGQSAYGDWYVVGSANMCGSAWNPMDPNNLMSVDKDGFYTKTYFLEPDYYEFKIVQGAWEDEFNYNDVITTCTNIEYTRPEFDESDPTRTNICFTLTESSIVTITLDISEGICLRQMLTTLDVNIGQSWIFSTYTNNFDPIDLGGTALVRGMDTWNGKIYFPLRGVVGKHKILIYDGESGEKMRSLALQKDIFTKIENGDTINAVTLPNNDLHFDSVGNCLIGGCVISTDEDMQSMLIYKVNLETGGCDEIINEPIMDNVRFDAFDVYGDVNNDAVIMAIDNNSLYCYRWTINNAIVGKAEKILLPKLYGPSWNKVTNARMLIVNDSIFYVDGWGSYANRYKYKGGNIEYLDNSENTPDVGVDNSNLAGCTEFSLKDKNGKEQYFFISAKTNGDDGGYTYYYDLIQFADENKNFAEATYLCSFPENTSKMNSNTYRTAEVSVEVVDNIANIYIYIGENGYALYRFSIDGQEVANVVKSIIVSIPENVKENNLYIELVNTKTDDHQKYAISDKDTYTFYGLTIDVVYDIYLKTQQGSVVSEIKGVELKNEDVSVAFESCQIPQTVNITVLTPEKEDITSEVQISWFDSKNTFIKRSSSVTGFVAGDSIYYSVSLPYALGVKYQVVDLTSYEVNDSDNDIVLSLLPLEISRIKGVVKDSLDNELISEAIISVNQTINGKYTKTETYKADKEGVFSVDVIKDYTEITISAGDYIAVKDTIIDFADSIDLGVIKLQRITGAVIDLNFTYTERALADAEPKVTSFYSDYNNVFYVIFNKTQNKAVSEFSVQYPRIVLLEEVSEGDILEITISCKKNSFMPFVVESEVKEDKTVAEINILQFGAIKASYAKTDNSKVVGILYNAEGRFVKKQEYKKETLNITDVVDGDYTLITMGASELFNDVYNIEAFQDLGLTEGVDYVENKIAINSGIISCIDNKSIPSFDESKLYYTDASSNFSINKNSVVVGNYVTLKGMVKFKPEYEGAVNDVNLVVDIPENAIFTENSVIKGYTIIPYTIVNNQIVIPIEAGDNVRFCITPFLKGDYKTTAYVDFEFGGKRVLQPIGSVSFEAENLNINVPSVVSKKEFIISGKAYANTKVQVYDDDLLIGETTTLGNGIWSVTCTLNEPYNLSTHKIYAKTITEQGLELFTEVKECQYDVNAIEVKTVTMINFSHRYGSKYEERTVFDFLNEQKSIPAYWYWPSYPEFTFLIDFTQNDTSKISNVILYVETSTGDQVPINAEYNEKQGKWVATKKFENDGTNIPVNVSLDFDVKVDKFFDRDIVQEKENKLLEAKNDIIAIKDSLSVLNQNMLDLDSIAKHTSDTLNLLLQQLENTDSSSVIVAQYLTILGNETHYSEFELDVDINPDSLSVFIDSLLMAGNVLLDKVFDNGIIENPSLDSLTNLWLDSIDQTIDIEASLELSEDTIEFSIDGDNYFVYSMPYENIDYSLLDSTNIIECNMTDSSSILLLSFPSQYIFVDSINKKAWVLEQRVEKNLMLLSQRSDRTQLDVIADKIKSWWDYTIVLGVEKLIYDWNKQIKVLDDLIEAHRNEKISLLASSTAAENGVKEIERQIKLLDKTVTYDDAYKQTELWNQKIKLEERRKKLLQECEYRQKRINALTKKQMAIGAKQMPLKGAVDDLNDLLSMGQNIYRIIDAILSGKKDIEEWDLFIESILPCEYDSDRATNLFNISKQDRDNIFRKYVESATCSTVSFGVTGYFFVNKNAKFIVDFLAGQISDLLSELSENALNQAKNMSSRLLIDRSKQKADLKCNDDDNDDEEDDDDEDGDDDDDNKKKKGGEHKPKGPGVEGIHDPSGFIYEGVPSNRLEGVMASCYYKEEVEDMYGDKQENIVLWDAENYAQENPLFTDKNGMYRWDVPQGLWQVKFEKEGYQTTYSEWLPVPPPQLEVNVEMVQNVHPEVANVRAYESGIEIDFSKYMTIQSVNVDNIVVSQNGENVAGTLTLLNKEQAYLDSTITYVSKVRFNPLTDFSTDDKVTLKVSKKVESYVGMQMESDYIQSFDVVKEVKSIEVDSLVILSYDSSKEVEVEILPAEAAEGKNLIIQSVSPTISTISRDTVKIDADGKISVTIFGELPGNAAFNFAVEGTNISATTLVKVVDKVEEPYSSVASGTAVYYGTKVSLYCSTEDVTIYYTLDGSCPCGDNALVYVEPIVIDNAMTIKAFAVSADGIESEIVEFEYTLKPYVVTLTAENGVVLGGGEYDYGTEITITAVANAGYEFVKWSDDNTDNPRKLVVTQNITLAAEFMFKEEQTNIESVEDDKCVVYYENGVICVNNGGKEYYVYDAVGKLVYFGTKNSIVLPRGVYMIVVGGEVEKVVI